LPGAPGDVVRGKDTERLIQSAGAAVICIEREVAGAVGRTGQYLVIRVDIVEGSE
jgi:hypothetical protein